MYRVPDCNLSTLEARIDKLARRATKLGLTPPSLGITGHEDIPVIYRDNMFDMVELGYQGKAEMECRNPKPEDKILYHRRYHFIELRGEAPVLPGWDLLAIVEHSNESDIGNVIRTVPGKECPTEYRHAQPLCQHCNSIRRRNDTFVLQETSTGTYKQVGRNCLADFCRSPEAAAHMVSAAEYLASAMELCSLAEEEDGFGMGGRGRCFYCLEEVLGYTASFIRHVGWVSKAKAPVPHMATAEIVLRAINDRDFEKNANPAELKAYRDASEEHAKTAEAALSWIRGMREQADTLQDYFYNLLVVCSMESIERKHFGLACSLIAAYNRATEKSEKAQAERTASNHFGTVKARAVYTLTVLSVRAFDGNFGTKELYRFKDEVGNVAIWWASSSPDLEVGKTYKVKGTVKAHSDYNGVKQTELSRCAIVD